MEIHRQTQQAQKQLTENLLALQAQMQFMGKSYITIDDALIDLRAKGLLNNIDLIGWGDINQISHNLFFWCDFRDLFFNPAAIEISTHLLRAEIEVLCNKNSIENIIGSYQYLKYKCQRILAVTEDSLNIYSYIIDYGNTIIIIEDIPKNECSEKQTCNSDINTCHKCRKRTFRKYIKSKC